VNPKSLTVEFILLGLMMAFAGCVSSEETGAGDRAKNPVQILGSIDTARYEVNRNAAQRSKTDTAKLHYAKQQRVAPKFKSNQDTVLASVVKKSKLLSRPRIKNERHEHPVFTVQIGAYSQASNALRIQKRARGQFTAQPVFNRFVKSSKMYQVSIGRYENRKDAFALCDTMKQKYPKEYNQCWVNSIP
jgi:hypothetical protein